MRRLSLPNRPNTISAFASWADAAVKIINNSPNPDWKKHHARRESDVTFDVPLSFYNPANGYKLEMFGKAKAAFFSWDNPDSSFVGFVVAMCGNILEAAPVISLNRVMDEEARKHALNAVARHIENRRCPKCGKFDTLRRGPRIISCRCGYRESAI